MSRELSPGAFLDPEGHCVFRVWAPFADQVTLWLTTPMSRRVPLEPLNNGYHEGTVDQVRAGQRYFYLLDDTPLPDPASRSQPQGVHGPSEVTVNERVDLGGWRNPPLRSYVIYELHVGTFTPEGTFDAIVPHLAYLRDLGVTAVELMPISEFPGGRNWGYDGVFPYAAESAYGGPDAFRRLVSACHDSDLAVVLDVVYNHLGPEGNYLGRFAPYFTDTYRTPWGQAINFDGPDSDEVLRYFIENALYWTRDCGVDALRLDAIHAIVDPTAQPFLGQLSDAVHKSASSSGRSIHLIAESALNDPRVCWPTDEGGLGMDAHWNDDFHHAVRVALTGERTGYYKDFSGVEDVLRALAEGYVYQGQYSRFRRRRHGRPPDRVSAEQIVVYSQNHDQIGNRARGDRPSAVLDFESLKLAAGLTLLSPFTPLIFMGEEYAEPAPFPYFVSHGDPELAQAVREGRSSEFEETVGSAAVVPDPQAPGTFQSAKLDHDLKESGLHRMMLDFYRELLALRAQEPLLLQWPYDAVDLAAGGSEGGIIRLRQSSTERSLTVLFNFAVEEREAKLPPHQSSAVTLINSADERWGGGAQAAQSSHTTDGSGNVRLGPRSFVLVAHETERAG